jgi:hypothetical protein
MREIQISKDDLRIARVVDVALPPLAEGAARLRIDLFALTSNNITYAAMGTGQLGYWDFFPGPEGWGRPPVWGFATVVQSTVTGVEEGTRVYGYLPISETLDVTPIKVGPRGFADGAAHRSAKSVVYNHYLGTATDPAYDPSFEPEQTLFRPLYATGWWLADCVHQDRPRCVVISSASSKTAIATAHRLRQLGDAELVGLTSARNESYVRETGLYHRALTYDQVASLAAGASAIYVDFLGRDEVTAAAHSALGANLVRSMQIGVTDWADKPGGIQPARVALMGPTPEFFFVPTYAAQRLKAEPGLNSTMQSDMRAFYAESRAYVTARRLTGADEILTAWGRLAAGETPPNEGLVVSF